LDEWDIDVDNPTRLEDTVKLPNGHKRVANVLQGAGAEYAIKRGVVDRQGMNVADYIHIGT
jgi:hypothetical protein